MHSHTGESHSTHSNFLSCIHSPFYSVSAAPLRLNAGCASFILFISRDEEAQSAELFLFNVFWGFAADISSPYHLCNMREQLSPFLFSFSFPYHFFFFLRLHYVQNANH